MQTSGFTDAPVSRWLVILTVASSWFASITDTKQLFSIDAKSLLYDHGQYWRLLAWQACFTNSTQVLFACLTIYQLRVVERLWGSRKFLSFIISTLPYAGVITPLLFALVLYPVSAGDHVLAGPTAVVFAVLAQYHAAIPCMYRYESPAGSNGSNGSNSVTGSGISLTSKLISYLAPLQLAMSQLPGSAVAAAVGWTIGYAYRRQVLPGAASRSFP